MNVNASEKEKRLLKESIIVVLERSPRPMSSKQILRKLELNVRTYKTTCNSLLYHELSNQGIVKRIDGTPPLWELVKSTQDKPTIDITGSTLDEEEIHVMIDVDNSPCLREADPYAKDEVFIWAYAAPAYNHHKPACRPNLLFEKLEAKNDLPSAADVLFIMKMTELCQTKNPKNLTFIIVSKDKILSTAAKLVQSMHGCQTHVITDGWESLKVFLE